MKVSMVAEMRQLDRKAVGEFGITTEILFDCMMSQQYNII